MEEKTNTHLDSLIRATCDQPSPCNVEGRAESPSLSLQRAGLGDIVHILERSARIPVPERERAIVASGEEDALRVDGECIDDRIVAGEVEDERALWTFPLLDVVSARRGRRERVFRWVNGQCANGLLVMCERDHGLTRCEVP